MPRDLYKPLATPFSALFLVCTGDTLEFRISTFTSQELEFCNTLLEVDDTKVSMISFSVMTRGLILSIIKLLISSSRSDVNVETPLSCIVNSTADILSLNVGEMDTVGCDDGKFVGILDGTVVGLFDGNNGAVSTLPGGLFSLSGLNRDNIPGSVEMETRIETPSMIAITAVTPTLYAQVTI